MTSISGTTTSTFRRSSSSATTGPTVPTVPTVALGAAVIRWTGRAEGHLGIPRDDAELTMVERARHAVVDRPWTWLRQVHGATVVVVDRAGDGAGEEADAAVTAADGAALAVFTADCAPIAFASREGVIGVAHAGWRGLAAGVVGATATAMRALGATDITAALGPCIHPECYEFSPPDLDRVADVLGPEVRGRTATGRPALDLPAGVRAALERARVDLAVDANACTACTTDWFSHRARGETGRQATLVWVP